MKSLMRRVLGFILLASINCTNVPSLHAGEVVDGIAAIVGEEIILHSDVRKARAMKIDRFSPKRRGKQPTNREILEELIKDRLLRQEIGRLSFEVSPEELQQGIASVLAQNRMGLATLKSELASKGIPFEEYKKELAERIRMIKFMSQVVNSRVEVTDEDFEIYKRRFPQKSKRQSKEEIRQIILENKSRSELESYLREVRERTYVEIK